MLSDRESTENLEGLANAVAQQRLEGLEPDARTVAELERVARGELDLSEVLAQIHERVRRGEIRG